METAFSSEPDTDPAEPLASWVARSRHGTIRALADASGLPYLTVWRACRGGRMRRGNAERLAEHVPVGVAIDAMGKGGPVLGRRWHATRDKLESRAVPVEVPEP